MRRHSRHPRARSPERGWESNQGESRERQTTVRDGERDQSEGESEIFLRKLQALMKPTQLSAT
jgi:hypothetical protein